jgi:dienelactone hydrolase
MRRGVVVACVAVLLAGCGGSGASARHVALRVTPHTPLIDTPVNVRLSGMRSGERVRVSAQASDADGARWTAGSTARADEHGMANVDGGELLAVMRPHGRAAISYIRPAMTTVRLTATIDGRAVASGTVERTVVASGVTRRVLTVGHDGLAGEFFSASAARRVPVVVIGGSDGARPTLQAALLAAHGHRALALSYFDAPGLPRELLRIPLEYFARGLRWVRSHTGAHRVALVGTSRGGEGVLIIGSRFPALVAGVVALVPGSQVGPSPTRHDEPAWTIGGRPLPLYEPIAVERIRGPVLIASGGRDAVWPSADYAREIQSRLHGWRFAHPNLSYPAAGHNVGFAIPFVPGYDAAQVGGTPAADAAARAALWPRLLDFLDRL